MAEKNHLEGSSSLFLFLPFAPCSLEDAFFFWAKEGRKKASLSLLPRSFGKKPLFKRRLRRGREGRKKGEREGDFKSLAPALRAKPPLPVGCGGSWGSIRQCQRSYSDHGARFREGNFR